MFYSNLKLVKPIFSIILIFCTFICAVSNLSTKANEFFDDYSTFDYSIDDLDTSSNGYVYTEINNNESQRKDRFGGFVFGVQENPDTFCQNTSKTFIPYIQVTNTKIKKDNIFTFVAYTPELIYKAYECRPAYDISQKTCYNDIGYTDGNIFILRNDFNLCEILLYESD